VSSAVAGLTIILLSKVDVVKIETRNTFKALQGDIRLADRHTIVCKGRVSDPDLPSKASEPRSGQAIGTHERNCRDGEAERNVSGLKRCGGCFQFQWLQLNRSDKRHSKNVFTKLMH